MQFPKNFNGLPDDIPTDPNVFFTISKYFLRIPMEFLRRYLRISIYCLRISMDLLGICIGFLRIPMNSFAPPGAPGNSQASPTRRAAGGGGGASAPPLAGGRFALPQPSARRAADRPEFLSTLPNSDDS